MPRKSKKRFVEKDLTKGQLRKLNALRKSVGDEIGEKAFADWLETQAVEPEPVDKNAVLIAGALQPLIDKKQLRIPRTGYYLRRGRGRVIVEVSELE